MQATAIGDALFTKTQQRVLGLLYGNPHKRFYTNEIMRWAGMGRGTVRRELERLVSAGLLVTSKQGNQLYYQANTDNPVYADLVSIVRKTFGVADVLKAALAPVIDQIEQAFIYGSIAKGEDRASSDIDLMVVTESLGYGDLMELLSETETPLGRPVNPTIYDRKQLKKKLKEKNAFLIRVMEQPKIWIKETTDVTGESG